MGLQFGHNRDFFEEYTTGSICLKTHIIWNLHISVQNIILKLAGWALGSEKWLQFKKNKYQEFLKMRTGFNMVVDWLKRGWRTFRQIYNMSKLQQYIDPFLAQHHNIYIWCLPKLAGDGTVSKVSTKHNSFDWQAGLSSQRAGLLRTLSCAP